MTVDGRATRKTDSLAGRSAGTVSPGHVAAPTRGAISDVSASSEGRANDVPTPFYDLLTAMIKAQALENELIRRHESATGNDPVSPRKAVGGSRRSHGSNASEAMQNLRRIAIDTVPGVANHPWRVLAPRLNALIAGLIVTAAIGGVTYFLQVSMRQPHVVAAVDEPSKAKSPVVAPVVATTEPVLRVEERGGPGEPGVDGERAIE